MRPRSRINPIGWLVTVAMVFGTDIAHAGIDLPVVPGQLLTLGSGYAPDKDERMATCITGKLEVKGKTKAEFALDQPAIDTALNDELFPPLSVISYGEKGKPGPSDYIAGLLPGRRVIKLSYFVKIGGRTAELAEIGLNDLGRDLNQSATAEERLGTCGHLYVRKVELGGYLLVTVNIRFLSQVDRKTIQESGIFTNTGLDEIAGELFDLGERYKRKLKVSVDVSQVGGQLPLFYKMIQDLEDQGWLSCAYPDIGSCAKGIQKIYDYTTAPDGLYAQLNRPIPESGISGFAIRNAHLELINAVSPDFTNSPPAFATQLRALDGLIRHSLGKNADLAQLNAWQSWNDSRLNPRGFQSLKAVIEQNIGILSTAIQNCRFEIEACESVASQALAKLGEELYAEGFFPKSFLDVCLAEEQSLDERAILEAISAGSWSGTEGDCHELRAKIQAAHTLDLARLGLQEVSLLYEFDQLTKLELAGNQLRELVIGDYWPNLSLLDLAHNQLVRIRLRPNQPLAKLYLEGNKLTGLEGRYFPTGLGLWTVFDNPLNDKHKTRLDLQHHTKNLIVTPLDLCALHGRNLLPLGFYDEAALRDQLASGQGPDYSIIAGTTRFKGWRPCTQVYTQYPRI